MKRMNDNEILFDIKEVKCHKLLTNTQWNIIVSKQVRKRMYILRPKLIPQPN